MTAHPFRFDLDSPLGPVRVDVLPGRVACISGRRPPGPGPAFPLSLRGNPFDVSARYQRGARGWEIRDMGVTRPDPSGAPGHVEVALVLTPFLARVLEAEMRRFVERDLVEVHRERRDDDEAKARVQAEIDRRRAKLEGMDRATRRAEPGRARREESLRAELAGLPGGADPGTAAGGSGDPGVMGAPPP